MECMELYNPQVVFLDVEMPSGTGFDFLLNIGKHNFHVVFITAHESYALKAIDLHACVVENAAGGKRLSDRKVRVMELDVFADERDRRG